MDENDPSQSVDEEDCLIDDSPKSYVLGSDDDESILEDARDLMARQNASNISNPLTNVYSMNQAYLKRLQNLRELTAKKLQDNLKAQEEATNGTTVAQDSSEDFAVKVSSGKSMTAFLPPYFKDVRGMHPPDNEDVHNRREYGLTNQAYIPQPKKFTPSELKILKNSVLMQHVFLRTQPLTIQLGKLQAGKLALEQTTPEHTEKVDEKIIQISKEIEDLSKSFPTREESDSLDWMRIARQIPSSRDDVECKLKWINEVHPDINQSPFTKQEQETIKELVLVKGFDWKSIAQSLSKEGSIRLDWMVASEFQQNLNLDVKRIGPLSPQEIYLMDALIEATKVGDFIPWTKVAYFIKGRSVQQLKHHYVTKRNIKLGVPFTELEDKVLVVAVARFGEGDWKKIAENCFGRSNRQCRERYVLRLKVSDRKIGNYDKEEDMKIMELASKHRFKWTEVEKLIERRNAKQIATRYERVSSNLTDQEEGEQEFFPAQRQSPNIKVRTEEDIKKEMPQVFESTDTMDKFLRESRAKLEQMYKGKASMLRKRSEKVNSDDVERELVQMFAFYHDNKYEKTHLKQVNHTPYEVKLRDSLSWCLTHVLEGKGIPVNNPLGAVIKSVFDQNITSVHEATVPVMPPNRITLMGLQKLLVHQDYLLKKLSDAGMTEDIRIAGSEIKSPEYMQLLNKFFSVFLMPALCSITETPSVLPLTQVPSGPCSRDAQDPGCLHAVRDKQNRLIDSIHSDTLLHQLFSCINLKGDTEATAHLLQHPQNILYPGPKVVPPPKPIGNTSSKRKAEPKKSNSKKFQPDKVESSCIRRSTRVPKPKCPSF